MISILGISAFYHDSAAALILDGKIIAAAQEERFSRKKHDSSYPFNAVKYVLKEANLKLSEVNYIIFYEKPFLKFERLLETYVAFAPKGFQSFSRAMPVWLREKLFLKHLLIKEIKKIDKSFDSNKLLFGEHHFTRIVYKQRRTLTAEEAAFSQAHEAQFREVVAGQVEEREIDVDDVHFDVLLCPGAAVLLDLGMRRFVHNPSYANPW